MDIMYYAAAILLFVAVALAVEALWQWWFSTRSDAARRIRHRLSAVAESEKADNRSSLLKPRRMARSAKAEQYLRKIPGVDFLDNRLQQSGSQWSFSRLLINTGICFALGLLLALMMQPYFFLAFVFAAGCGLAPYFYIERKRNARLVRLEYQLPEVGDMIARSLRAGHAFPSTVQMVADEMPEPMAGEFRLVADEVKFGVSMAEALQRLAYRIPLTDLRYMVVAILIQRETGGNLADLMTSISSLIRERLKLLGQIRTLSAEGRLSAWVLALLPFGVCIFLGLTNPGYFNQLIDDPAGKDLIMAAIGMMIVGGLWMRKIIHIHI